MIEKKCTKCGNKYPETDFHITSRKYENPDTGFTQVYVYRHAKCKYCRYKELKAYKQKKSRERVEANEAQMKERCSQPFNEWIVGVMK